MEMSLHYPEYPTEQYPREIAAASLSIGAIELRPENPFRWASGYRMPIYNDNRMLLSSARTRALVISAFVDALKREGIDPDIIAGTATAGIPHATSLADRLGKPLVYVRGSSKSHGRNNRIEGLCGDHYLQGKEVLLVEDLISTGGSSIGAVKALRDEGAQVSLCLAIFSYGLDKADEAFGSLAPPCRALPVLQYGEMIAAARQGGYITEKEESQLLSWREDPFGWGEKNGFPPEGDL